MHQITTKRFIDSPNRNYYFCTGKAHDTKHKANFNSINRRNFTHFYSYILKNKNLLESLETPKYPKSLNKDIRDIKILEIYNIFNLEVLIRDL